MPVVAIFAINGQALVLSARAQAFLTGARLTLMAWSVLTDARLIFDGVVL